MEKKSEEKKKEEIKQPSLENSSIPTEEAKSSGKDSIKTRSKVWQYFSCDKNANECKCTLPNCGITVKFDRNTSNMLSHMKAYHSKEYAELQSKQDGQMKITSEEFKLSKLSKTKDDEITIALARFMAKEMKPFRMLYTESFQNFMKIVEPRYVIPSRATFMTKIIPKMYEFYKGIVIEQLKNIKGFGLTFDLWKSIGAKCFITITIHFLNDDFNAMSFVLKTEQLTEAHTGKNIAKIVKTSLIEFFGNNINSVSEKFVVTDGAANMINAGEVLKWPRFQCFAHVLHNALTNGMNEAKISDLVKKIHDLVTRIKSSAKIMSKFEELQKGLKIPQKKLKIDNLTRWNSKYLMIKRVILNKIAIIALISEKMKKIADITISEEEWNRLSVLKDILRPFYKMTKKVCENETSISIIKPLLFNSYQNLLKISENDSEFAGFIKSCIRKFLKYYENMYEKVEDFLYLATYLDPRFKGMQCAEFEKRSNILSMVKNYIRKYSKIFEEQNLLSLPSEIVHQERRMKIEKASTEEIIFGPILKNNLKITEIDRYDAFEQVSIETNPLYWWKANAKNFQTLSLLAKIFLCIPASSVRSEQVFSKAGLLLNQRRTDLSSKSVDHFIFISSNSYQDK